MRSIILSLLLSAGAGAQIYCGPSTTGNGSGSDFSNLAAFTGGGVRGNTYVLVDGSYGGVNLNTAASGTTRIVVRKADSGDSGVTGYASTLHDGQASFTTITVEDPYYTIDGRTRTVGNVWTAPTDYGIEITTQIGADSTSGHDSDNTIIKYCDIGAAYNLSPSSGTINGYTQPVRFVYDVQDLEISYCAIHNGKQTLFQLAHADNVTVEYCDIGPGWGKEAIRGGNGGLSTGWTIRHNRFYESTQTDPNDGTSGITAEIGIWDWSSGTGDNFAIYGNVFYNSKSGGRNSCIVVGGDASSWAGNGADNTVAYNNTFAGFPESSTEIILNGSTTVARNNLAYAISGTFSDNADTSSDNTEVGSDPFTDYAGDDWTLSGATAAGTTLSSPYDVDRNAVTRGADGTWDLGAFDYVAGGGGGGPTLSTGTLTVGP